MLNEDYREMLQILLDCEVEFLVIGAFAMGAYGYPRATGDIDLWVMASTENSKKIYLALKAFGAPLKQINDQTFAKEDIIFQIGLAPRRIDIITGIDGVVFRKAYERCSRIEIDGLKIPFISKQDLIKNKESTARPKDKLDADYLRNLNDSKEK